MTSSTVTVFGGTGFLGRAIVQYLAESGNRVRVASRHPAQAQFAAPGGDISAVCADVRDAAAVAAAVKSSRAVVNAVGLYVERGGDTFAAIHVQGAQTVAQQAAAAGVERLVHLSGIGASADSASRYVRSRAEGERCVQAHFPNAIIVRPSVLFGPHDALLNTIDRITRQTPVLPLFGTGRTRLQPVYVEDVAWAVQRLVKKPSPQAPGVTCYELGGPRIHTYRELVEIVLRYRQRRRLLLPVPFFLWTLQAQLFALLPNPPLTVDQVVLMRSDNVVSADAAGFADLGINPRAIDALLLTCLGSNRDIAAR